MIEKWVNFKRDYLEISFLREKWVCAISPYHRRHVDTFLDFINFYTLLQTVWDRFLQDTDTS